MPNTEQPIDLETQVMLMKKYVNFRQRKKMREFLGYAGYFRASRYGKYLLTQVNAFGSKADSKVFFDLYNFDVQLRLLLFKYCKKSEIRFKSAIANAVSLKTGDAGCMKNLFWNTILDIILHCQLVHRKYRGRWMMALGPCFRLCKVIFTCNVEIRY